MSFENFKASQFYYRKSENLTRLGFDFENPNQEQEYKNLQLLLHTEYNIKCESMPTIMKHFGIPSSKTMFHLFKLFNIEARSLSEATSNAIQQNRPSNPPISEFIGKSGWHKTWDGRNVFLRSSYELAYAKQLDEQCIEYYTEHFRITYFDTQRSMYRIAIPDFWIPSINKIVEIKSYWWYNELEMKDKLAAYLQLGHSFELIMDGDTKILVGLDGTAPSFVS